jgi:hypothetical protein
MDILVVHFSEYLASGQRSNNFPRQDQVIEYCQRTLRFHRYRQAEREKQVVADEQVPSKKLWRTSISNWSRHVEVA